MVYIVLNEGEVVMATRDKEKADSFAYSESSKDLEDTVRESGRDIDDLTDDELAEFSVRSGFDGGYYEVEAVDEDTLEEVEEIETESGYVIDTCSILDLLEDDEVPLF